ncbi:MAG: prenyltransferase/squalene oxidase repeat-containing protein [Pirellulales bacterium]|nr:prenyltransferase/squalene oxidase repeat-containing protein [Pirellulales bacterium]
MSASVSSDSLRPAQHSSSARLLEMTPAIRSAPALIERDLPAATSRPLANVTSFSQPPATPESAPSSRHQPEIPPTAVAEAIRRTQSWLLQRQEPAGYWCAELEGDTILESEFILLWAFLGREQEPLCKKLARQILDQQLPTGGWAIYPGGELEISASVKAYFALKLTGQEPSSEPLQRARRAILRAGGADRVNSFTRFYLALLGQIPYACCPEVPPEFFLLPTWFPINPARVSAWSRPMIATLSIMSALQPITRVPESAGIAELFLTPPRTWNYPGNPGAQKTLSGWLWKQFFSAVDRGFRFARRRGWLWWRKRALNTTRDWILARFAGSDGLAAIFPPMVWSIIALKALGYGPGAPEWDYAIARLLDLVIETPTTARVQPCKSPVWDTALTARALAESGLPAAGSPLLAASHWLCAREVRFAGDWSQIVKAQPGGWAFEFDNQFYPDLDDTAMVLMALAHQYTDHGRPLPSPAPTPTMSPADAYPSGAAVTHREVDLLDQIIAATQRGAAWMLAMQNRDGGWGAFDRDNNAEFLCQAPFADHNAMIDPSTPDLTARVLEALGRLGKRIGDTAVDRAVAYLRHTQEADGSWYGRWGINYIYGTWQALQGLAAVGVSANDPLLRQGANWLLAHQQPSGGWGESAATYEQPKLRGQGPATASQTAWALLGLLAAGHARHPAVRRGMHYLLVQQRTDGSWEEAEWTGTGFPCVFYLKYHYYPIYFPLLALGRYQQELVAEGSGVRGETREAGVERREA